MHAPAIENGADAVYFGLNIGFNARARAANIELAELPGVMAMLHGRGVKGYVTLNTLIFAGELAELERTVRLVAEAGVDAVLVQDLGAVRLIRAICPDLPIHASTQMTLSSAESIRVAERLGVERVVLARELSLDEMRRIRRLTAMPLETFVHGALCVAYSGQCMTSESLGGRSANRGQCAQACRLPYELVCDGRNVDLGAMRYLLSPQDLAAFDIVPQLMAAGICSFKIEGRLKTPEYVANMTRHYRQAIQGVLAGAPAVFTPRDVEEMELSFSRGFSHGWLEGCDHKKLVPGLTSAKHGVLVGTVAGVRGQKVLVELCGSLKRGDGIVFDGDRTQGREQGGRVFEIFARGRSIAERVSQGRVELAFGHGAIDMAQLGGRPEDLENRRAAIDSGAAQDIRGFAAAAAFAAGYHGACGGGAAAGDRGPRGRINRRTGRGELPPGIARSAGSGPAASTHRGRFARTARAVGHDARMSCASSRRRSPGSR